MENMNSQVMRARGPLTISKNFRQRKHTTTPKEIEIRIRSQPQITVVKSPR